MIVIYCVLIGVLAALFTLATWWRYAAPIPPWSDDESKEESCPRK